MVPRRPRPDRQASRAPPAAWIRPPVPRPRPRVTGSMIRAARPYPILSRRWSRLVEPAGVRDHDLRGLPEQWVAVLGALVRDPRSSLFLFQFSEQVEDVALGSGFLLGPLGLGPRASPAPDTSRGGVPSPRRRCRRLDADGIGFTRRQEEHVPVPEQAFRARSDRGSCGCRSSTRPETRFGSECSP